MSSTNKTTNYELSQYIGSDKPTYLGDYNSDMLKIDTQMKTNANNIQSVSIEVSTASATANTALSNANTADEKATTADTTANTALQKSLDNEANLQKFNLNNISTLSLTSPVGGTFSQYAKSPLKIAKNNDGSIFKLYGSFELNNVTSIPSSFNITTSDTGLRPAQAYDISPCGVRLALLSTGIGSTQPAYMTVNTDGTVDITVETGSVSTFTGCRIIIFPCLYFNSDFGD